MPLAKSGCDGSWKVGGGGGGGGGCPPLPSRVRRPWAVYQLNFMFVGAIRYLCPQDDVPCVQLWNILKTKFVTITCLPTLTTNDLINLYLLQHVTVKLMHYPTTTLSHYRTIPLPNYPTTVLPHYCTIPLPNYCTTPLPNYPTAPPRYQTTPLPKYSTTTLPN